MEINSLPMYLQLKVFTLNSKIKKRSTKFHFKAGQTLVSPAAAPAQKQQKNRKFYPIFKLIVQINQNKNKGCHPVFITQAGWMEI